MSIKFDHADMTILESLQEDGRLTNVELARRCGISAPPCLRRVKNLETHEVITGYHAVINPAALGFELCIYAEVGLVNQSDTDLQFFISKVQEWPLVRECYMLAGDADFLLRIVAHNWEEYQRFLSQDLTALSIVKNVKSKTVMQTNKRLPGVPVTLEELQAIPEAA